MSEADAGNAGVGTEGNRNGDATMTGGVNVEADGGRGEPHSRARGNRDSREVGCGSQFGGENRGYRDRGRNRGRD